MKLLILDGNSVINRAYFGVRPLTTREGLYTHAIYGFLNILERMEKEEQPEAVCVAFDLHGPTFRHLQYDGYKATRHGMPEELAQQMPVMKDVLRAMNIPIYECQGWEADDVIGTVGKICAQQDWECVIVTGDRDSLQLVNDHVHVKLVISKAGQTNTTLYTPGGISGGIRLRAEKAHRFEGPDGGFLGQHPRCGGGGAENRQGAAVEIRQPGWGL